jgi:hypothetical protein
MFSGLHLFLRFLWHKRFFLRLQYTVGQLQKEISNYLETNYCNSICGSPILALRAEHDPAHWPYKLEGVIEEKK